MNTHRLEVSFISISFLWNSSRAGYNTSVASIITVSLVHIKILMPDVSFMRLPSLFMTPLPIPRRARGAKMDPAGAPGCAIGGMTSLLPRSCRLQRAARPATEMLSFTRDSRPLLSTWPWYVYRLANTLQMSYQVTCTRGNCNNLLKT